MRKEDSTSDTRPFASVIRVAHVKTRGCHQYDPSCFRMRRSCGFIYAKTPPSRRSLSESESWPRKASRCQRQCCFLHLTSRILVTLPVHVMRSTVYKKNNDGSCAFAVPLEACCRAAPMWTSPSRSHLCAVAAQTWDCAPLVPSSTTVSPQSLQALACSQ